MHSRLELKNTPTASLQRGKKTTTSDLDMILKQSDGEVPSNCWGFVECGITPSSPSLPGPLWPLSGST